MMKKAVHIFFASLMLLASAGIPISKHYCGKQVKDVSFFSTAKSCMEYVKTDAPGSCELHQVVNGTDAFSSPGCCNTETDFQKTDLYKGPLTLELTPQSFELAFLPVFDFGIPGEFVALFKYDNYHPPQIGPDITLLVQSFLC